MAGGGRLGVRHACDRGLQRPESYRDLADGTRLVLRDDAESRGRCGRCDGRRNRARVQPLVETRFEDATVACRPTAAGSPTRRTNPARTRSMCGRFRMWAMGSGRCRAQAASSRSGRAAVGNCSMWSQRTGAAVMSAPIERRAPWSRTPTKVLRRSYFFGMREVEHSFRTYDVSLDGQRFLMIKDPEGAGAIAASPNITVVQTGARN